MAYALGLDIGGTKLIAAAGTPDGRILAEATAETRAHEGGIAAVRRAAALLRAAAWQAGLDPAEATGLGVGAPGPLDLRAGMLLDPPNLGWGEFPLRDLLRAELGLPVWLTNDCKAAGLGEHRFGAGRGAAELLYLGIGTGIGGCIISGGQVRYGFTGNAGEFGHMTVALDGPVCGCGRRGCLEALASGSAIGRMGREAALRGDGAALLALAGGVEGITGATVAAAAAGGDPTAAAIVERAAVALGTAIGSLMNGFGPERVILGGGVVAKADQAYLSQVADAARQAALPGCLAPVLRAELGEHSGLYGALALVWAQEHPAVGQAAG